MICYLEKLLHLKYNTIIRRLSNSIFIYIKLLNSIDTQKHGNKEKLSIKKNCLLLLVNLLLEKTEKSRLYHIDIFA